MSSRVRNSRKAAARSRGSARVSTGRREAAEVARLQKRIEAEAPEPGQPGAGPKLFSDLPLSAYTLSGLKRAGFTHLTAIQRATSYHALAGRDVLGAAKTGSGKTLAFMVPTVEALFRASWDRADGVGALVIAPTRELAQQIFEVVRVVCDRHYSLTAGYVTGGKSVRDEARYISQLSILVATPGRLLQHLEQTPGFHLDNLRVLVLDEADRLLDMGFQKQLNAVLGYLPADRQTMLFSATQTKKVKDLARLSMNSPEFVSAHNAAPTATPLKLTQHYTVCELPDKMNVLYSFIKSHLKCKTIVFLSSCKQARFVYEVFRRVRPGVSVMALHGKQKPKKRSLVYMTFLEKTSAVLFATDIAARGLDFPGVDWVLQLDCPEDAESYIHRVGRTARYRRNGHALLCVTPGEAKGMLPLLEAARVPLKQIKINPHRAVAVTGKIAAEVAADHDLRHLAQRAFVSYLRSVFLQPNKDVFDVTTLPFKAFALSLGLPAVPKTSILGGASTREQARAHKNKSKKLQKLRATIQKAKAAKAADRGASSAPTLRAPVDDDADDELLQPKQAQEDSDSDVDEAALLAGLPDDLHEAARARVVRMARASRALGKARVAGGSSRGLQRLAEAGGGSLGAGAGAGEGAGAPAPPVDMAAAAGARVRQVAARLKARDAVDRARERRRVQAKHLQERLQARDASTSELEPGHGVLLAQDDISVRDSVSDSDGDSSEASIEAPAPAHANRKRKAEASAIDSLDSMEAMALQMLRQRRRLA